MSLKILQLNIELDKHLDKIFGFIHHLKPDVITMQEVFLRDIQKIEKTLGMKSVFAPMRSHANVANTLLGVLVLSPHPLQKSEAVYYRGEAENPPSIAKGTGSENIARCILKAEVAKDNHSYLVMNTHFTWTPDGKPNQHQYEDVERLLMLLDNTPEFILCGDFNAPRGGPIFEKIAARYQDNIPAHIDSTLDKNLHKMGHLNLMVDGLFTTPGYRVNDIEVVSGLSDHCGIVANITCVS